MSKILQDDNGNGFLETECKLEFHGQTFESGGSWLLPHKETGKMAGIMYADTKTHEVTSWDGKLRIPATFGQVFNSNFRDWQGCPVQRQYCWFTYNGHNFIGINYSVNWRQDIFCREIKAK